MKSIHRELLNAILVAGALHLLGCAVEGEIQSGIPNWYPNPPETEDTARGVGVAEGLTEALSYSLGEISRSIGTHRQSIPGDSTIVQESAAPYFNFRKINNYSDSYAKSTSFQYFGDVKVKFIAMDHEERFDTVGEADSARHFEVTTRIDYSENDKDRLTIKSNLSEDGWGAEAQISHFFSITDDGFTIHDLIRYLRALGMQITIARDQGQYYVLTQLAYTDYHDDWARRARETRRQEALEEQWRRMYNRVPATQLFEELEYEATPDSTE